MVATTRRWWRAARNSRYQIPCHVPVACEPSLAVVHDVQWEAKTHQFSVLDGNCDTCSNKGRLDVRRHVIRSLGTDSVSINQPRWWEGHSLVSVQGLSLRALCRRNPVEGIAHVLTDIRVPCKSYPSQYRTTLQHMDPNTYSSRSNSRHSSCAARKDSRGRLCSS